MTENVQIRLAKPEDLDLMEALYTDVTEGLAQGKYSPDHTVGWRTGIYPVRETAEEGLASGGLYLLMEAERLAASVILNSEFPDAYREAQWDLSVPLEQSLTVHTLCTHPDFAGQGAATVLLDFAERLARERGLGAVRFDTGERNVPAQRLYEHLGYRRCGKIIPAYDGGTDQFFCYEKLM